MTVPKPTRTFFFFSILSLAYILLVAFLPPNAATVHNYHLSDAEYHILNLLLAFPRVIVWFAAFYGYARLDRYSFAIRKTADGRAFEQIGRGLRWLAWGLPIASIVSNIAGGITHAHPGFLATGIIITHFTNLLAALAAFTIISGGTRRLVETSQQFSATVPIKITAIRVLMFSFLCVTIAYCYATIRSVQTQHVNPYHMPMWLILLTVVIPYLYAWLMGLLASYEIWVYRKHTNGVLYKHALTLLANGMGLAIITSVILQYITSSSNYLRRIQFDWNLLLVYIVLVLYAAGFILIAVGANKLKKIEEV